MKPMTFDEFCEEVERLIKSGTCYRYYTIDSLGEDMVLNLFGSDELRKETGETRMDGSLTQVVTEAFTGLDAEDAYQNPYAVWLLQKIGIGWMKSMGQRAYWIRSSPNYKQPGHQEIRYSQIGTPDLEVNRTEFLNSLV